MMNRLAKKHLDKFEQIKSNVEKSYKYFRNNTERFVEHMRMVFETSLTDDDIRKLGVQQKPALEFPILEAYISAQIGKFLLQEPTVNVGASESMHLERMDEQYFKEMEFREAHLRDIIYDANRFGFTKGVFKETLGGGFSAAQVYADYVNSMTFEQQIILKQPFDTTLCGWDPMAREPHKGDGQYCFECVPRLYDDFVEEFGEGVLKEIGSASEFGGFTWTFKDQDLGDIIIEVLYYEKQYKKTKIFKLSNGHVVTEKQYKDFLELWEASQKLEAPPVVLEKRDTEIETIHRYRVCGTTILEHKETYYKYLPIVYFDGNSVNVKESNLGASSQFTKPYTWHAKGAQKLYNYAGQTMANELENMVQHKFMAAVESVPEDYQDAYANPQQANVLLWNAYDPERPDVTLPKPEVIPRMPPPPVLGETFAAMPQTIQSILGSYDAVMGIVGDKISGAAIEKGSLQTDFNCSPYIDNYIISMTRVCEIIVDLMSKLYVTPRTLPIRDSDGKRSYVVINNPQDPNSISFKHDAQDMKVKLEAGVSNVLQKQASLRMLVEMSQASPIFAEFINTMGLEAMLSNMDIHGIDKLKEMAKTFMEQKQQQAEQAAQTPPPEVMLIETQKQIAEGEIQARIMETQGNQSIQAAKVAVEQENAMTKRMEALAKLEIEADKQLLEKQRLDSENARTAIDAAINLTTHFNEEVPNG